MRRTDAEFGAAVRRLLGERQLTLRAAAYKTNLNYTTVMQMARGAVPRQDTIIAWARGMGEPIDKWLVLAGYTPLLGQSETAPPPARSNLHQAKTRKRTQLKKRQKFLVQGAYTVFPIWYIIPGAVR